MDILLIYPPLSVNERYGNKRLGKVGGNLPPLGIAYIASYLRQAGFSVGIIDGPASDLTEEAMLGEIRRLNPRAVGFSAITPNFHRAVIMAERMRSEMPDVLSVIGGHHASILSNDVMKNNDFFDILVSGEGEETSLAIMRRFMESGYDRDRFLKDASILNSINGISYRNGSDIVSTPCRPPIQDLDLLPFPAWDLLPMDRYIPLPNQYLNKPVMHMVSIRGCAFQCSFCSNNRVFGNRIRALSPNRLVEMIRFAKENYGIREVSFWDDSMTTNRRWITEYCERMIREDVDVTWTCYSRVDTVNADMLKLMKKAGCWNIFYGFESGNQELLDMIDKKITLEQIRQVSKWTKDAGIEVRASFMIALPGETPEMAKKTIDFAISIDADYAQFSITTPFPETKLYEDAKKHGIVLNDFSKYNLWEPVFIPFGYKDKKEIEDIGKLAVRKFYFRPKYIICRIKKIRSFSDFTRLMNGLSMAIGFVK